MLDDWKIGHLLLAPDLVLGLNLGLGFNCGLFWFLGLRLVLFTDLCLDFGIGPRHLLLLTFRANGSRVQHAAFVRIFDDIRIFLASDEILECH